MTNDFLHIDSMEPVSLAEMDSVHLMNRTDTKYLTDIITLERVMEDAARKGHLVFENNKERVMVYRSMYYDTPNLQMYLDHHNCRLTRQKIRTRCYVNSNLTFLEVKFKNNHGRTKKKRIAISPELYRADLRTDEEAESWLNDKIPFHAENLSPSLETSFSRITLVNREKTERSTIDLNLTFRNTRKGMSANMGDLAIIEVKQDGNYDSVFRQILLEHRVKPVRISKYCIGTALTDSTVKSGRFKEKLMLIDKMIDCYE